MKILYDGWPLVSGGDSPAAIHLLTLLAAHPADIPGLAVLPGPAFHTLPDAITPVIESVPESPAARLHWEQRLLPGLARRTGVSHIHTVGGGLALFGGVPGIVSPAGFSAKPGRETGFTARLEFALSQGGAARACAWLWPSDLPEGAALSPHLPADPPVSIHRLPPVVHPYFRPVDVRQPLQPSDELASLDLPETYILHHGPADSQSLDRLLDAWSWAAGAIGVNFPLLCVGMKEDAQEALAARLAKYGLTGTARPLPPLPLPALAELYRRSSAVLHLGDVSPWADPVRLALASGRPIAVVESQVAAALVGPAAYLAPSSSTPAEEARSLGAALLSVIVEDTLAETLAQTARERAEAWGFERFRDALRDFYRSLD